MAPLKLETLEETLIPLTKSAYEAERSGQWTLAYDHHAEAIKQYTLFAKSASRTSSKELFYKQLALKRSELHQQRMDTIYPWAKGRKPVPSHIVVHPSSKLFLQGVSDGARTSETSGDQESIDAFALTLQQIASSGQAEPGLPQYTASLPQDPAQEYVIALDMTSQVLARLWHFVVTVSEPSTRNTLYILEAWCSGGRGGAKIREAIFYRTGDHPVPTFRLTHGATSTGTVDIIGAFGFATHILDLDQVIWENPDRPGRRFVGGTNRFVYGGRKFVRKAPGLGDKESIYEYTTTKPSGASKTGKLDDDACAKKLFWVDKTKRGVYSSEAKVFTAAGLDPLFKEYIFAVTMMRMAVVMLGVSPSPSEEDATASKLQSAAGIGASIGVKLLATVVGNLLLG